MAGYGELIQTIGAMVIFSLILLSANRMIQRNTYMQVAGELEQEVIALGQEIIEESRTKEFDEHSQGTAPPANIPGDFTAPAALGPETGDDSNGNGIIERTEFDDFDDFHGWQDTIDTEHGAFNLRAYVYYVTEPPHDSTSVRETFKRLRVEITSKYLDNLNAGGLTLYSLEFVRNYYAD